jgi:hypothetical protein
VAWRWTARRLIVSAFVIFHLSALVVWTIPPCYIKDHVQAFYKYYVLPAGVWQWWAIFAPDPVRNTVWMDVEVVDAKGIRYLYEFPRIGDLPFWQKSAAYRQPKFVNNMSIPEYFGQRKTTARHALRQLGVKPEAFPCWVSLYYLVKDSPEPGTTAVSDPMAAPRIEMIERFEFVSMQEVRP